MIAALAALGFAWAVDTAPPPEPTVVEGRVHIHPELVAKAERVRNKALDKLVVRGSLSAFVRRAWPLVSPGVPLEWNWHLDVMCRYLERASRGELKRLVICVPPRSLKSSLTSIFWPAWLWLFQPHKQFLAVGNDDRLPVLHARQSRNIVESDWYATMRAELERRGTTPAWDLEDDQNAKVNFATTRGGHRMSQSINGTTTGKGGDIILVDDPIDARKVITGSSGQIASLVEAANGQIFQNLPTRLNDRRTGVIVLIMQRLCWDDPAAQAFERGWVPLVFPMHYDAEHPQVCPDDRRTSHGELLFPERFSAEVMAEVEATMAPVHRYAQMEQRPSPPTGAVFQREWFRRVYHYDPIRPPKPFEQVLLSVDCTFKGKTTADRVAITVWGRVGPAEFHLLDVVVDRMGWLDTRATVRRVASKWRPDVILIEDAANGPALVEDMAQDHTGVIPFSPAKYGNKSARANRAVPIWQAGCVWVPEEQYAPWLLDFVEEHVRFLDGAANDDLVDSGSQALIFWKAGDLVDATHLLDRMRREHGFLGR